MAEEEKQASGAMTTVSYWAAFIGGGVAVYLLISLGIVDRVDGIPGTEEEPVFAIPTYLSFVSVMLTAVTVVLAAVANGVGVVAAYTFNALEKRASATVLRVSEKMAREKVEEIAERELSAEAIERAVAKVAFSTGAEDDDDSEQER